MDGGKCNCYIHPEQVFVGICPSCLYERLILLASKPKSRHNRKQQQQKQKHNNNINNKPLLIILPRVLFGFGARNHRKSQGYHTDASSPPQFQDQDRDRDQDDSFISIRFEKNGVCAWDKGNKVASSHKVSMKHCSISSCKEANSNTRVVEPPKPQASLRWRKRIGQLFQLARWRRSYKVNSKFEGVKVKVRNY